MLTPTDLCYSQPWSLYGGEQLMQRLITGSVVITNVTNTPVSMSLPLASSWCEKSHLKVLRISDHECSALRGPPYRPTRHPRAQGTPEKRGKEEYKDRGGQECREMLSSERDKAVVLTTAMLPCQVVAFYHRWQTDTKPHSKERLAGNCSPGKG